VLVAAYGPKSMRLAGEVADGVIIGGSADPAALRRALEHVRLGAAAAGRDPSTIEVWGKFRGSVDSSREKAIQTIKAGLASNARTAFDSTEYAPYVPAEVAAGIAELKRRYSFDDHVNAGGQNARLIDQLGLTEWLADQLAVAGTPEECQAKIRAIRDAGIDNIIISATDGDPDVFIPRFAEEVVDPIRGPGPRAQATDVPSYLQTSSRSSAARRRSRSSSPGRRSGGRTPPAPPGSP
jgi:5,10-methylenetetrahydromethanopterin reductase